MAPPLPEGAARAVRKRIGAPDRQRAGQGHRLGVPLAGDAGERHARDYREIAAAETINESYVSRVLRLTLLAPDIVESILDGRQLAALTLAGVDEAVSGRMGTALAHVHHCKA